MFLNTPSPCHTLSYPIRPPFGMTFFEWPHRGTQNFNTVDVSITQLPNIWEKMNEKTTNKQHGVMMQG